jgi:hypothetical protein
MLIAIFFFAIMVKLQYRMRLHLKVYTTGYYLGLIRVIYSYLVLRWIKK